MIAHVGRKSSPSSSLARESLTTLTHLHYLDRMDSGNVFMESVLLQRHLLRNDVELLVLQRCAQRGNLG